MLKLDDSHVRPALRGALLLACLLLAPAIPADAQTFNALTPVSVSAGTAHKPQSKVWHHADTWWAIAASTSVSPNGMWLWRLEPDDSWTHVLHLSSQTTAYADAKRVGDVTHVLLHSDSPELVSLEYVPGSNTYQLWTTRPAATPISLGPGSFESATIDIDSTGRMWLATEAGLVVRVYYSDFPYSSFSGAINLGTSSGDDVATVTALPNNTVGVLWSDQVSQRFGFRIHEDGTDPNVWLADEVPASQSALNIGDGMADDDVNVAVASDGTLYAAVKTSYDTPGATVLALLVRRLVGGGPSGVWDDLHEVSTGGNLTLVLLNEVQGTVQVVYQGGPGIVYRETATSSISFGSQQTLIAGNPLLHPTSSKENWTVEFVVLATSGSSVVGVRATLDDACTVDGDCDDGNTCSDDVCNAGVCENPPVMDGTLCDDGVVCTTADVCTAGVCGGVDDCPEGLNCNLGSGVCEANQAPDSSIDAPAGPVTITKGQSVEFAGSGTDPENDLPLSYQWDFDESNSGVAPSTLEDPGPLTFSSVGTFVVTLTVTDSLSQADPTPASVVVTVQAPGAVPNPNVGHWPLDDASGLVASDISGNSNDGSLDGAQWQVGTPDASTSAVLFDGLDDRVDFPAIDVSGQALTIALWFKVLSYPSPFRDGRLLSKATGTSTQNHYWMLSLTADGPATRLRFRLKTLGTTSTLVAPTSDVVIGQWSHLVAVYDGATMRLYQDGADVGSLAKSGALDVNPAVGVAIGNQPLGAGSAPLHGAIDEVGIFDRALDPSEVVALYLSGPPHLLPSLGQTARWFSVALLLVMGSCLALGSGYPSLPDHSGRLRRRATRPGSRS